MFSQVVYPQMEPTQSWALLVGAMAEYRAVLKGEGWGAAVPAPGTQRSISPTLSPEYGPRVELSDVRLLPQYSNS